jgi:hypothetical protein
MRTAVVTDSSAPALPPAMARSVVVVPITILLADRQIVDHHTDPVLVHQALDRGQPVKTRAPSVIDYLDAVENTDAEAAVILTPAAELTAMWRHACHTPWLADRPVAVVDSRTAASGQSLVVAAAAEAAAAGSPLADVTAVARQAARRARVVGVVGTVEPLVASGMVDRGRIAANGDRRRPTIFEARHGAIEPLRVLDGQDVPMALSDLYAHARRGGSPVVFTSAGPPPRLREVAERLAGGAAMTVYTGRDVVGLAWLDDA